jgi:hypothetical protein
LEFCGSLAFIGAKAEQNFSYDFSTYDKVTILLEILDNRGVVIAFMLC